MIILGTNQLRQYVIDVGQFSTPVIVGIALGQALVLYGLITVVWRLTQRQA